MLLILNKQGYKKRNKEEKKKRAKNKQCNCNTMAYKVLSFKKLLAVIASSHFGIWITEFATEFGFLMQINFKSRAPFETLRDFKSCDPNFEVWLSLNSVILINNTHIKRM